LTYGESDRLGSVAFLPPERLTSGERTPAGDMYGLGATLYYLLTTRLPHSGDTPLAMLLDLQQSEPPAVSTLRSDIPPSVDQLIQRLLSREPASRPAAAETAETLAPYCEPTADPSAPVEGVLLASETSTFPSVPTAAPVPEGTYVPAANGSAVPLVEPLPEVQPLDEHAYSDVGHHDPFGHSSVVNAARAARPRAKATSWNKILIIAGLILHLTGTIMCLGYFGIIPNPFARSESHPEPIKEEKKDQTPRPNDKGQRTS
jgi:serine/threonine protein kinase